MREINSTQRRRRLRLIKAEVEQADDRSRHASSSLAPASNTEATRIEVERIHRRMMMECRAKPATRIRIEFAGKDPQFVSMNRPYLLIGSSPTCDVRLDHDDVKPHHTLLHWVNGQIFCCDLIPRSGADQRQQTNGNWFDREPIRVGPFSLTLENHEHPIKIDESPLDRSSQLAEEFPQLAFQFVGVEQNENLWSVNRTLTMIGRGSQCKLRLNHPSMPNVQACLLRTRHCCWIIDIEGIGTTGVNGRAVSVAPIDIGDILQIGPFQIEVVTSPLPKQDLLATSTTKKSNNSQQNTKSEQPSQAQVETRPKSLDATSKVQVKKQPSPVNAVTPKTTEPAQVPQQPTIKERLIDPTIRPGIDSKEAHPSLVVSNSEKDLAENESAAEVARHQPVSKPEVFPEPESTPLLTESFGRSIASFILAHETQLSLLKEQLERVKAIYDRPRRQSIPKRARSMLDQSIRETMKTQQLMQESLEQFTLSIKR